MRIIRGKYGRRRFDVPTNITARPTTDFARENIFNVLENMVDFDDLTALDLFAGTGAISFELLSRGCAYVTAVEKANTQYAFMKKVAAQLGCDNFNLVRGDALRYIDSTQILNSQMLKPGTIFIIEHSRNYDFSHLPHFSSHRTYGSVNFSIFIIEEE